MIRTAIIYRLVDHCIDIVFDNIESVLLMSNIINPGDRFKYLETKSNVCFYDVVIKDVYGGRVYFGYMSSITFISTCEDIEILKMRIENTCFGDSKIGKYSTLVIGHTLRVDITYREPMGGSLKLSVVDLNRSMKE